MINKRETIKQNVESFNTDFVRRLNFETLGKNLLNCAERHANLRGFGVDSVSPRNHAWVLVRLSIELSEIPTMFDPYDITTWIESVYRMFTNRNFEITKDGHPIGYARSVWAIIDKTSREAIDLEGEYGFSIKSFIDNESPCPLKPFKPLKPLKPLKPTNYTHIVLSSDIDYNGHVNSMKYITFLLDGFDLDYHSTHTLKRIDIAYINESHFRDVLSIKKWKINSNEFYLEIRNQDNNVIVKSTIKFE